MDNDYLCLKCGSGKGFLRQFKVGWKSDLEYIYWLCNPCGSELQRTIEAWMGPPPTEGVKENESEDR